MLIYNTTFQVDDDVHDNFMIWIKESYIPEVQKHGALKAPRICRILSHREEGSAYSLQWEVESSGVLHRWHLEQGVRLNDELVKIFKDTPVRLILYGSYARGDFHKDSDLDIMILADVAPEEISYYADKVYDITYDFEMEHNLEINPNVQSQQIYNQWKKVYPFFMNIEKDGVFV